MRELLDLFFHGDELLARLLQSAGQPFVGIPGLVEFLAGLVETFLECVDLAGGRIELPTREGELLFEQL